jgi:hypothetical protein
MARRFQSLDEFWPYYLAEHRNVTSRRLHFAGTTGWLTLMGLSAVRHPVLFPAAVGAMVWAGKRAIKAEADGPSKKHIAFMLALPTLASPVMFPAGVVCAYGFAWAGHFGFEKNKPASFKYPIMSLTSDLRMWSLMCRGKLWKGDPLREMGFAPQSAAEPVSAAPGAEAAQA